MFSEHQSVGCERSSDRHLRETHCNAKRDQKGERDQGLHDTNLHFCGACGEGIVRMHVEQLHFEYAFLAALLRWRRTSAPVTLSSCRAANPPSTESGRNS